MFDEPQPKPTVFVNGDLFSTYIKSLQFPRGVGRDHVVTLINNKGNFTQRHLDPN